MAPREKARAAVPLGVLLVLSVVFSAVAIGSLVLVGVDLLAVGSLAGGDVLNAVIATVFWMLRARGR